jgi:hypothetical protein
VKNVSAYVARLRHAEAGLTMSVCRGRPEVAGRGPTKCGSLRWRADDRYQVAVTPRLDPENAETVVVIMESNSLDETGENFLG